jgi:hypothetical protein
LSGYEYLMANIDSMYVENKTIQKIILHPSFYSKMWECGEPSVFKQTLFIKNIKFELSSKVKDFEIISE